MKDKNGAFGVDLLLPQVGGNARKTNVSHRIVIQKLTFLSNTLRFE